MSAWAHIENIVIVIAIAALLYFGNYWSLLLLLALNTRSPKKEITDE